MCASTYPVKLIDNLRAEIEALKKNNEILTEQLNLLAQSYCDGYTDGCIDERNSRMGVDNL